MMKHSFPSLFAGLLILSSIQLFSQTYFNVLYSNTSQKTIDISQLSKITFSGTDISFRLNDSSVQTDALSTISTISFGASNGGSPLPVELMSFTVITENKTNVLSWETATEVNNYGFQIERRTDNQEWQKIGFVNGYGNSNSRKVYSFNDKNPPCGTVQYRLKQIDFDGTFEYSSSANVIIGVPAEAKLEQNYPNPFNPLTKIVYNLPKYGFVSVKVFNVLGKEVTTLVSEDKNAGSYEVTFDGSGLASGVYFCKMCSGNYSSYIKMLIVK